MAQTLVLREWGVPRMTQGSGPSNTEDFLSSLGLLGGWQCLGTPSLSWEVWAEGREAT